MLRALLHDYFAFARNLEKARAKFASYVSLSPTQYMILIVLAHSPNEDERLGISQIAERLHLSGAFVTIEVNKLVAEGLVDKSEHPHDRRRVQLVVTDAGVSRLERLAAFQRPVNDALFGVLSSEEFRLFSGLLARLAANGPSAVKLANTIEATMELAQHRAPSPEMTTQANQRRSRRRTAHSRQIGE